MDYEEDLLKRLQQIQDKQKIYRRTRLIAFSCVVLLGFGALIKTSYDDGVKQEKFREEIACQQKDWSHYRRDLPANSFVIERKNFRCGTTLDPQSLNTEYGFSEFMFDNPYPSNNIFVVIGNANKVKDGYVMFFLKKGDSLKVALPYGTYDEFLLMGNDTWYGDSRKFGLETEYFRSDGFIHVDKNFCTQYWSERVRRKWGRTSKPTLKKMPYKKIKEQEFDNIMRKFGIKNWLDGTE